MSELQVGQIGIYQGSNTHYHGILFEVVNSYLGMCDLAYAGGDDDPERGKVVLRRVRHSSLRVIDPDDILFKDCPVCGDGPFWRVRGEIKPCPMCLPNGVTAYI